MNELYEFFNKNKKVGYIKKQLKESLDDNETIDRIYIVINTDRNLFDYAKSIDVKATENKELFEVSMLMENHPDTTLLSEIYNEYKKEEWKSPSYGHENPMMVLITNKETINKLVNWLYSKLN